MTERILLVDDEEGIVHVTKTLLVSLGYTVSAYTSSIEALAVFRSNPQSYALVITDLTMPKDPQPAKPEPQREHPGEEPHHEKSSQILGR